MGNYNLYLVIFIVLFGFTACQQKKEETTVKTDTETAKPTPPKKMASAVATISAKNDSGISGTVTFTEIDGKVSMIAAISGLTEGNHAIHIHAVGDCSSDDGKSAGGHWNPTNVNHGVWGTDPFHKGDIGNLVANADGQAAISRDTDLWCIGCSDENNDIVGKAIIIHEGPDDFSTQPAGAAGPRIGCGEIVKQ